MSKELAPVSKDITLRLTWFDRFVGFFSPRSLLKRQKARLYNEFLQRKYEAADGGRRTSGWQTGNRSANAEISAAQTKVRDRARDLVRNNPYAARGVQVITNNVVGRGIKTQIKTDDNSKTNAREKRLNRRWRAWSETTACDWEGYQTFSGLQSLAMRGVVESGEVFIRRRREARRTVIGPDGREIEVPPFSLQLLEADFLPLTLKNTKFSDGRYILQGIEYDQNGKRLAYHFYKNHPGTNQIFFGSNYDTVRVPAEEVLHLYRPDRPGQSRGMPWLHPVVMRLRDFDLYEDAQLKRQQVSAMFAAFIHDIEGIDEAEETKEENELGEKMEPGLMEILPPGKEIKFSDPPGADNYGEYTSVVLHAIAVGLGINYFQLTDNLKDINFSAGRLGFLETQRNFDTWRNILMVNQFLNPTFSWFKEGLDLIGENTSSVRGVHTAPRREMIDPTKEVMAMKTAVRSGFKSLSDAIREQGLDPDTHFEELAQDAQRIDELELVLDTDARKVNNAGSTNVSPDEEPENNDGNGGSSGEDNE